MGVVGFGRSGPELNSGGGEETQIEVLGRRRVWEGTQFSVWVLRLSLATTGGREVEVCEGWGASSWGRGGSEATKTWVRANGVARWREGGREGGEGEGEWGRGGEGGEGVGVGVRGCYCVGALGGEGGGVCRGRGRE
ncbi:hypothetical protein TIFTF001_010207 [Ficus carica]|uniref:Uncharacterized protein n=1 Tax=Ficus carica TaxID=3494 RepID=A0AA87ZWM9_FICCA|nr:hypothetical protein TIFTF001_010207 [Ficus carica]